MKKFLLGILVGVLVCVLLGVFAVGVFGAIASFRERKPTVSDNSTLVLRLSGPIEEIPEPSFDFPLPGMPKTNTLSVLDLHGMLRRAAKDPKIRSVLLEPRRPAIGWGRLQEIQTALAEFKKSGKPLYAHLSFPSAVDYMLAASADRVFLMHDDVVDVKGLRAEATFFKGSLEKLGAEFEVETAGKYKDAGTPFTRKDLSPESREVLNALLDAYYSTMVDTIAKGRKRTPDQVRAAIDQGPWTAKQALALGMVDGIKAMDEVEKELDAKAGRKEFKRIAADDYHRSRPGRGGRQRIAILTGQGSILRGEADFNTDLMVSGSLIKQIRKVRDDSDIVGVVFRVNSGGGDAVASEEILREVKLLSQKKPLVISFSDVAASGGYYVACTGDPIVAYPNTITGSIGVIYSKIHLRGFYDKIGMSKDLVTRGKMAGYDSDYVKLDEVGRGKLKELIAEIYGNFLDRVATARKRPVSDIEPLAQGRVWTGTQAKERGLVDELGGLDTAVELVKKKAKLTGKDLPLVLYPRPKSLLEQIFTAQTEEAEAAEARAARTAARKYLGVDLATMPVQGFQYRMPYIISVQ
jgi:protease-4